MTEVRDRSAPPAADRRVVWALAVGLSGVALITVALVPFRDDLTPATPALVLLVPVVLAGRLGQRAAALIVAVAAGLFYNLGFIQPYWTVKIHVVEDFVAAVVFALVAFVVGDLVAREAERRRAAEERAAELERLHSDLEAVQQERARLSEATSVLERVDEQRRALLRSVSHDLRTPLATIRAVASDLRDGVDYDATTRDELLDLVADESERLDRLVGNLLSLSRIEAGAFQPDRQAVALEELAGECVRRLSRLLRDAHVLLGFPAGLPLVDADYSQIDQVLTNLLENAVRHAPPRTPIRVGARASSPGMVEVYVEDEGPGVPLFERERVFDAFRSGRGSRSSGIGLAICKAVVEAHGGAIRVEDVPGHGARFAFTLPVR